MNNRRVAVLFPGQGAFYGGALKESYEKYPQIKATFAEIDAIAKEKFDISVADVLFCADPPDIEYLLINSPDVLQLAVYGISVATYKVLESYGLIPAVLMGHSFGEIAAMVCAGSFSVREGAEVVCHRIKALKTLNCNGYMAALGTDPVRAEKLIELIEDHQTTIAGENHNSQTVVSGSKEAMDAIEKLASILKIPFFRLNSPHPFHSLLLEPAVADFADRIRYLNPRPMQIPVFSPILGRYYHDKDILTDCLAKHLIHRVRFSSAVQHIYEEGIRLFVECGALDTLSKLVKQILKNFEVVTIPTLDMKLGDSKSLHSAIYALNSHALIPIFNENNVADFLLPGVDQATFDAFWAAYGSRILSYTQKEFEAFEKAHMMPATHDLKVQDVQVPTLDSSVFFSSTDQTITISRDVLFKELTMMYAVALEYPEEVFTEDVELEAELGIDSVKQTELLARVGERYHLPPRSADFRLSDYHTMGKITDFVFSMLQQTVTISIPMVLEQHAASREVSVSV